MATTTFTQGTTITHPWLEDVDALVYGDASPPSTPIRVFGGAPSDSLRVTGSGGITVKAPTSGDPITSYGKLYISGTTVNNQAEIQIDNGAVNGRQWRIGEIGTPGAFSIYDQTGGRYPIQIGSAGNTTMAPATSGVTLAVSGVTNSAAGSFSTGISVGNTANTSTTVLDWYEESSAFVPTLSGIGTPTYTTQHGYWQRMGNTVFVHIYLVWTGGTNAASFTIGTLPYTPFASFQTLNILVNTNAGALTWTGTPTAVLNGGTQILIVSSASGSTTASILNQNAGTKDICITGTYRI
jgi:hypothetical protein